MIGGLLIDALVVGAVALFAWAGMQLGGIASATRTATSLAAFLVAALVRDPVGSLVHAALGASTDLCRLVGMLVSGAVAYLAIGSMVRWALARREARRNETDVDEDGYVVEYEPIPDPLDGPRLGGVAGGVLGLGWALLFAGLLVLQPADNLLTRAAVASFTGGRLIHQEHALHWLADGFPHYTQTLPKGELGAVVGEQRGKLPMRGSDRSRERPRDVDVLLRAINLARRTAQVRDLVYEPSAGKVASRHAAALVQARRLSATSPSGATLDERVRSALGESAGSFAQEVGVVLVWSHSPSNAGQALIADRATRKVLRDGDWTEVGVGTADAGWFNGRIYVLVLLRPLDEAGPGADATSAAGAASDGTATAPAADAAGAADAGATTAP